MGMEVVEGNVLYSLLKGTMFCGCTKRLLIVQFMLGNGFPPHVQYWGMYLFSGTV